MTKQKSDFLYSPEGYDFLVEKYVEGIESAYTLAKQLNTYSNKIYRALKFHCLERKTKAEAQRNALASGNVKHPTEGRERTKEEKRAIGQSMHKVWTGQSEEQLKNRVDKARKNWYNIPEALRKSWLKKSYVKLREAAVHGSKFEKYLITALLSNHYKVQSHKKFLFDDGETSVDIYLPVEGIVIECNGVFHYNPVFGEETLTKRIQTDMLKIESLLANGYTIITLSYNKTSKTVMENFTNKFLPKLKEICAKENPESIDINVMEFIKES